MAAVCRQGADLFFRHADVLLEAARAGGAVTFHFRAEARLAEHAAIALTAPVVGFCTHAVTGPEARDGIPHSIQDAAEPVADDRPGGDRRGTAIPMKM